MKNNVVIVGNIEKIKILSENTIRLKIKNSIGYATLIAENTMAENIKKYCKKGDLVGIKGKIVSETMDSQNIIKISKLNILRKGDV